MTTDWKAPFAELLEDADELADLMQGVIDGDYVPDSLTLQPIKGSMDRARAALAQSEPAGVTDEELDDETAELIPWLLEKAMQAANSDAPHAAGQLTLAAQLLGERRPALTPIPCDLPEPVGASDEELLSCDELRDAWNAQADAVNSWDELGMDEIIWFAQQQALARWGRPAITPHTGEREAMGARGVL